MYATIFRHTLHTLKMLADEKEYDSLNQYLKKYINALPVSHVITYCQNNSVNALLNYLIPIARESAVDIRIYINIPEHLPVTDIDLCSILGNVLENAIDGCKTVSSEKDLFSCPSPPGMIPIFILFLPTLLMVL